MSAPMAKDAPATIDFFVSPFLSATCTVLVDDARAVVIDPGLGVADDVQAHVQGFDATVVGIVLTHAHLDHVADAPELARRFSCPVYVGVGDEYRMDDPSAQLPHEFTELIRPVLNDRPWQRPALVSVEESTSIQCGRVNLHAWHVPGHTEGSTVYVVDSPVRVQSVVGVNPTPRTVEGVAFTGDVLFAGTIGRTDLEGGNPHDMRRSLARLRGEALRRPQHLIVPGHGPVSTFARELADNGFLRPSPEHRPTQDF